MSLPVPLTVRVNGEHVTRKVESLAFRKEAVGGLRSISFKLRHPVDAPPAYLQPLSRVDVFDARTAEIVAQGRVADTGRTTADDGQSWDVVAFGPTQAASDVTKPKVWIDTSFSEDGWHTYTGTSNMNYSAGPSGSPVSDASGVLAKFPNGDRVTDTPSYSFAAYVYDRIRLAGGKLARVHATWGAGLTSGDYAVQLRTGPNGGTSNEADGQTATTATSTSTAVVGTDFANGDDTVALWFTYGGSGPVLIAADDVWVFWDSITIEALRTYNSGAEVTSGYVGSTNSGTIVDDLLGCGMLPEFDGPRSEVAAGTSGIVTQLAYMEGVSAAQVLADLMSLEPAFRWYTEPDRTGDGYLLRWETWPTTVRYEATIEDGGSFPNSTQSLYNAVTVAWVDVNGRHQTTTRTAACDILDASGLTRHTTITMPEAVGNTTASAQSFGDNFLSEHNAPQNGGTLNIARPIRDLQTGRMVEPFEIEAGELVRVRGVEAYPDALNADDNDGQSVFRIFAVDYTSDDNRAVLALDADPKTTAAALAKLLNERRR